jgi:hypothetical protein
MTARQSSEVPAHSPAAHRAISDELVRLTLAARPGERSELLFGFSALSRRMRAFAEVMAAVGTAAEDAGTRIRAALGGGVL